MSEVSMEVDEPCAGEEVWRESVQFIADTLPSCVPCPTDPGKRAVAALAARIARASLKINDLRPPREELAQLVALFGLSSPHFTSVIEESSLPCIVVIPGEGLGIVRERLPSGAYLLSTRGGVSQRSSFTRNSQFLTFEIPESPNSAASPTAAREVLYRFFFARKAWIVQLFLASTLASFLLLATSFYSMQVYDRVVANGGIPTLVVLTIGVLLAIGVEFLLKLTRMSISHAALKRIEIEMASHVFQVTLDIRLDAFPPTLGGLAAQLRGFEAIKAFLAARTLFLVCDLPFSLFFLGVIYLLGGTPIVLVPTVSLALALASGFLFNRRIHRHAAQERTASRNRQGQLIEALRNIELVKAYRAGWRMQGSWNALTKKEVFAGSQARASGEVAAAIGATIQQASYVGLVASGAYLAVTDATMTTGSIVACSILSGRIFAPIAKIPSLLVQWGHAKEALERLEKIFACQRDHGQILRPLRISASAGSLELRDIVFAYGPHSPEISLTHLSIAAGEKVAILGRVGAGKSTVLKMIAGLIKPRSGQVLVDGLDIFSITPDRRAELIGYLGQNPGLIQGTVRENLLMGHAHIDDDALIAACKQTGLMEILMMRHQGFESPIHENGSGFSGGQRQLIALTRLLLVKPRVWLLDEPTAALDGLGEGRVLATLRQAIAEEDTLVLVTPKVPPLDLVDRVIVINGSSILFDGPKERVLAS